MSNPYCLPELSYVPEDDPKPSVEPELEGTVVHSEGTVVHPEGTEQEMRNPPQKKFLNQVVAFGKPIAIGVLIIFSSAAVLNLTSNREFNGGPGMARVRRDAGMSGDSDLPPVPDRAHDPTAKDRIVVYNSVPKSGSTTMRALIDRLKVTNDYVFMFGFHDIERKRYLTNIEEDVIARVILNVGERAIYNKEVFYVNFTKFGYAQPTYINTIRDPADRKISRYFHDRSESKHGKLMKKGGQTAEQIAHNNMTMEDCIRTQDIECTFNTKVMVSPNPSAPDYVSDFKVEGILPYFCGNEYRCRFPYAGWTLNKAKESVERNYLVVGTLEDFDVWLQVIDYKLPQFFGGVYKIYKDEGIMANRADSKRPITDETYDTLKKKLRLEYDFYYWIRARLFKQFAEIQEAKQKKGETSEEDVKTARQQAEEAAKQVYPTKESKGDDDEKKKEEKRK